MSTQLFESKFKVGDKVRVLYHPEPSLIGEIITLREQYQYETGKYDRYWMAEEYTLENNSGTEWTFRDDELELVEQ